MSIIIFLIILLVLVLVHEFGHFFVAKRFKIRVDEFGFGFPPKLFGKRYGETEYSLNLLPLGGFVKIFGETPDDENMNGPDSGRSFINKPKWQQALVLLAGVFMNFLLAWILFSFGFMSGLPTSVQSANDADIPVRDVNLVILSVTPDSPAELAGLKTGDKIIEYGSSSDNFIRNTSPEALQVFIASNQSGEVYLNYTRGSTENIENAKIVPRIENGKPIIGIAMDEIGIAKMGFFRALAQGMKLTLLVVKETSVGLYGLIADGLSGKGSLESVTGPVGLVGFVGDAYQFGFFYLVSFAALISVNLAIINLFPFPALDGGRLLFLLIEKIKGSRIHPDIANTANMIGFFLLITLMFFITYHDIVKLF